MSKTSVAQIDLTYLAQQIEAGRIGIPEFQRDFDWSESDIKSLLATVFSNWPAGSLLLLDGKSDYFKLRPMDGAPALESVEYAVLDGQQRLTSIYQALYAVGDARFAINWEVAEAEEIEDSIEAFKADLWDRRYATFAQQLNATLIPLSALKSPTEFFRWRDRILEAAGSGEAEPLRDRLTDLYSYKLSAIHDYEFPAVIIDRNVEPNAVARIFEKVNRTGLRLNAFDLVVAKSFDGQWNLRDKWLAARESYRRLDDFLGEDGLPLLQAISLLRRRDLRQSAVLDLSKSDVQDEWERVALATAEALDFLRHECGVLRREFTPYPNMLPPLIALSALGIIRRHQDLVRVWFWRSGYLGLFDVAANTRLARDFFLLSDGKLPPLNDETKRQVSLAFTTKKSQKALWCAVQCSTVAMMERCKEAQVDQYVNDIDFSTFFSLEEIRASSPGSASDTGVEFRGVINSFLIPSSSLNLTRRLSSVESFDHTYAVFPEFMGTLARVTGYERAMDWASFRERRVSQLATFVREVGVPDIELHSTDDGL